MKKYISIIICLVLSVTILFWNVTLLATDEILEKSQELKELKQNKDKLEKERKSVISKERSVLAETKKIDKQLVIKKRELSDYESRLAKCEAEIIELSKKLAEAEAHAEKTRTIMLKRLNAMYKLGYEGDQVSYLKLIVGSTNISDLLNKYKYTIAIADGDRKLLEKASAEREEIAQRKKQVEERKDQILHYKQGTERLKDDIAKKGDMRRRTLSKLRESKDDLTRTIKELEQAVRELESLIASLRESQTTFQPGTIDDVEKMRGKMPWPTSGKIIENSSPSMKGVTIQAIYGSEIRTVASGIVEYAQWFDGVGFGQMVIINHGKGYRTLYAHASEILVEKGQSVSKNQVIAKVGNTGSFKGYILYFAIWNGTKAMPTRQWLR